jgi:hypothetical protein
VRNSSAAVVLEYAKHQHKEHQDDQRKGQHHPHALQIAPLDLLVVRLDVRLTILWTLSNWPQLTIAVARRRLIQLPLWRLERIDLCVCVVTNPLEAFGEAGRVLRVLSTLYKMEGTRLETCCVRVGLPQALVVSYLHHHCPCTPW